MSSNKDGRGLIGFGKFGPSSARQTTWPIVPNANARHQNEAHAKLGEHTRMPSSSHVTSGTNAKWSQTGKVVLGKDASRSTLQKASDELRRDKKHVLETVSRDGLQIQWACKKLRQHKKVAQAAVRQNGLALQHVGTELTSEKRVVLTAVKQNWRALEVRTHFVLPPSAQLTKQSIVQRKRECNETHPNVTWLTLVEKTVFSQEHEFVRL